jgi:uncharacterized membrane protein
MWTFLLVVLLAIVFGQKLSSLRRQNEQLARRLADLHLEIGAVRQAFLARIAKLEQGGVAALAPEEQQAPAAEETGEPVAAEPTEPSASETPAKASPPEPPPARFTPPPAPPDAEQPVYAPPAAARSGIEWERLIGVRGAALLGAIVLGLAALLFLQYSIEHGLIPPIVRVAIGFLVGASAIVGSEFLRRRGYISTANALAGGGVIVLYAATWAAKNLYGFIDTGLAFALMSLTTAVCGLLSWRHAAREIALLGLAGGFATPLLLSSGQNNPIGLFGYLLLLNIGLFALAREKKWPLLTLIGLCATTFYQDPRAVRHLLRRRRKVRCEARRRLLTRSFVATHSSRRPAVALRPRRVLRQPCRTQRTSAASRGLDVHLVRLRIVDRPRRWLPDVAVGLRRRIGGHLHGLDLAPGL